MLRMIVNSAPGGAKSYYSTADYYSEGQELTGVWRGKGAARLGLEGVIEREAWGALCDNQHPVTGDTLTQRQKSNRRVGYDFNFHVPKSVSVAYGLTGDERLLEAFRESVQETMTDMEAEMQARVRRGGKNEDRTTRNMVWGEFIHLTSRPVDGIPDPHLHAHCFVQNLTYDEEEQRWKAGQFAGLKRDAPYFEAMFHSRLASRLQELGFGVRRTRHAWELSCVPDGVLKTFSRRTEVIEREAREKGITDAGEKDGLGAKTRSRKEQSLSMPELRAEWAARLTSEDQEAVVRGLEGELRSEGREAGAARRAVEYALDHALEREAAVPERRLLTMAMKRSYGEAKPEELGRELAGAQPIVGSYGGQRLVTTREVLAEERQMLDFARDGRGAYRPLSHERHVFTRDWLNEGQRRAVSHLLSSRDRVMLVRGGAGTGKTALMQEAAEAIEAGGHRVFVFAPSADASRGVLRQEGFADADTVARLLLDDRMQEKVRGQVIWVDEAGLMGSRAMARLFDLADRLDTRVILSGDRRQHGSVERGAALRLLEDEAGLAPAEVLEIQRQKGEYKRLVDDLAWGRTASAVSELDRLGWIKETPDDARYRVMAQDYLEALGEGKSALVVAPTHREGKAITEEIREGLRASGRLEKESRSLLSLAPTHLTEAERGDAVNYEDGDVLVFHQNAKGYRKSERVTVGVRELPLDQAARYGVYHSKPIEIAPGERLRITRNGKTADGKHRLNNGQLVTVSGFDDRGNLVLENGWTVAKDYGYLAYGYVLTSHASQGKTVDRVFIGEDSGSGRAASREQFYVSVSRGRERATVYTDDKTALRAAIAQGEERVTATELVQGERAKDRLRAVQLGREQLPRTLEHEREHAYVR